MTIKSDGPHGDGPYGVTFEDIRIIDPVRGALDVNAFNQNASRGRVAAGRGAANISFRDVSGEGVEWAGQFLCAPDAPCRGLTLQNVTLRRRDGSPAAGYACSSAFGAASAASPPGCFEAETREAAEALGPSL